MGKTGAVARIFHGETLVARARAFSGGPCWSTADMGYPGSAGRGAAPDWSIEAIAIVLAVAPGGNRQPRSSDRRPTDPGGELAAVLRADAHRLGPARARLSG